MEDRGKLVTTGGQVLTEATSQAQEHRGTEVLREGQVMPARAVLGCPPPVYVLFRVWSPVMKSGCCVCWLWK
jgi:hypothetical protein